MKCDPARPLTTLTRRALLTRGTLALGATLLSLSRAHAEVGPVMAALSAYMASARERVLPLPALAETIHHVLDTVAAMISGAELPPGVAALRYARTLSGPAAASVLASNLRVAPIDAALINGILAHSDETDDSHGESQSHPGAAVVPAALALAQALNASGSHFLRAVALGYDVGPRVTMALGGVAFRNETRRSTHSIAGTFGAAATAGCVAALNAEQMRWLLDYASQQSSGFAVWGRDTDRIEKGFVFGGGPARNGVTAAMLVRSGFTGVDDVFSGADNYFQVNAPKGVPEKLTDGLGTRFEVTRTDIKKWTVGTPVQAPLDAIVNLRAKRPFTADAVQKVIVRLAPTVGAVVDKARDLIAPVLGSTPTRRLIDAVLALDAASRLAALTPLLQRG